MYGKLKFAGLLLVLFWSFSQVLAQEMWTKEQRQVIVAIERLSASTAPGGAGADEYGAVLAEEFSRWTVGSAVINDKQNWVEGLRQWFDDGWRVSDRDVQNLEILVRGDFAFTRRIVKETYAGPKGESSVSKAALVEIWVDGDNGWLLLRVNVHVMDSK